MMRNKYLVLLISCWGVLAVCCILKLLGLNIFDVNCQNQTFIAMCDYIDKTMWLKMTVACTISLILNSLYILAVMKQKFYTKLQLAIFIPYLISMSLVSWYSPPCQIVLNLIYYIVFPVIFGVSFKRVFLSFLLLALFQIISIVLKNIGGWNLTEEHVLTSIILQFDTLIMVLLYYLYSNWKGGV